MINLKPKFMTDLTFLQVRTAMAICPRCHVEHLLPPGKTQAIGLCADCCLDIELELKDKCTVLK